MRLTTHCLGDIMAIDFVLTFANNHPKRWFLVSPHFHTLHVWFLAVFWECAHLKGKDKLLLCGGVEIIFPLNR